MEDKVLSKIKKWKMSFEITNDNIFQSIGLRIKELKIKEILKYIYFILVPGCTVVESRNVC